MTWVANPAWLRKLSSIPWIGATAPRGELQLKIVYAVTSRFRSAPPNRSTARNLTIVIGGRQFCPIIDTGVASSFLWFAAIQGAER